jgi:hypothetical protein
MKTMVMKALLLSALLVSVSGCLENPVTTVPGSESGSNEGSNGSSGVEDGGGNAGGNTDGSENNGGSTGGNTEVGSNEPGGVTGGGETTTPVDTTPSTGGGGDDINACQAFQVGHAFAGELKINNGAPYTAVKKVSLQIAREQSRFMKISNTADCSCGEWVPYATSADIELAGAGSQPVSIQFKDYDLQLSECTTARINVDNVAPVVVITAASANTYVAGNSTTFDFTVQDAGAGVGACKVKSVGAGVDRDCNLQNGAGSVVMPAQAAGSYSLDVIASDVLGNQTTKNITWVVKPIYRGISQNYLVKAENKVDVLFVIDNSASMQYEQKSMAARMSNFMKQIDGLDYKIAVTTTDPTNSTYGDGRFVKLAGLSNQYVITPAMGLQSAQKVLGDTLQRSETGSASEQGIYVTYRAIERSVSSTASANKDFFRDGASLAVVLISDEDESAKADKNIPENLVALVKKTWSGKNFAFHSVITRSDDKICKQTYGATYGKVYEKMSALTGLGTVGGAIIGDVCATDYGSQLSGMGQSVQEMTKFITLTCAPQGDARSSVQVKLNGAAYSGSYEVQGAKIIFDQNLPVGSYDLSYQCL